MSIRPLMSAKTAELRTLASTHRDAVVAELAYRTRPGAHKLAAELGCRVKTGAPAPKRTRTPKAPKAKTSIKTRTCSPETLERLARGRATAARNRADRKAAKVARAAHPEDFIASGPPAGSYAHDAHYVAARPTLSARFVNFVSTFA